MRRIFAGLALILMLALSLPTLAQDPMTYTTSDEIATFPIPAGWDSVSTDDYAAYMNSDGSVLYLLMVENDDLSAAVATALELIDPGFALAPVYTHDIPVNANIWTENIYQYEDGAVSSAVSTVVDGKTYIVYIYSPSMEAITTATPDLNLVLLGATFAGGVDLTGATPALFDAEMGDNLTGYVGQAMETFEVPGAAIAIVQNGEVVYSNGFGFREIGGATVDADTLFMIGSTTKSMTTLVMGSLVDEGLLDWDAPVTDILPTFALSDADATAQIRVRDLVNNTSGVPRYDLVLALEDQSPEEVLTTLSAIPLVAQPGEQFNYSNHMVAAGGYVAALAAGATYGEDILPVYANLLQTRIFDPLGMTRSTVDFDVAVADDNYALPYGFDPVTGDMEALPLKYERFVMPIAPAGAVWSSVNEMAKYMQMQLNHGVAADGETVIISQATLDETQTGAIDIGDGSLYAMGWMVTDYNGLKVIEHNGNTGGFSSEFAFLPDVDLGIIILSNRNTAVGFGGAVREYIGELVFGLEHTAEARYRLLDGQMNDLATTLSASIDQTKPLDVDFITPYLGDYDYSLRLFINDDGVLAFESDFSDGELYPAETENSYGYAGLRLVFETADDGTVTATALNVIDPNQALVLTKLND